MLYNVFNYRKFLLCADYRMFIISLSVTASETPQNMWEIAHVWEHEENSQTTDVIAYLMQYLFDKVLLFFFFSKKRK